MGKAQKQKAARHKAAAAQRATGSATNTNEPATIGDLLKNAAWSLISLPYYHPKTFAIGLLAVVGGALTRTLNPTNNTGSSANPYTSTPFISNPYILGNPDTNLMFVAETHPERETATAAFINQYDPDVVFGEEAASGQTVPCATFRIPDRPGRVCKGWNHPDVIERSTATVRELHLQLARDKAQASTVDNKITPKLKQYGSDALDTGIRNIIQAYTAVIKEEAKGGSVEGLLLSNMPVSQNFKEAALNLPLLKNFMKQRNAGISWKAILAKFNKNRPDISDEDEQLGRKATHDTSDQAFVDHLTKSHLALYHSLKYHPRTPGERIATVLGAAHAIPLQMFWEAQGIPQPTDGSLQRMYQEVKANARYTEYGVFVTPEVARMLDPAVVELERENFWNNEEIIDRLRKHYGSNA